MSVFIGYPSFMAYQMMKGKRGNNDGFPSIPGMIARYSTLGLTNEQMATNPVWVDKTGNGRDLQLKNFSWKGMSAVGGYVGDFSKWVNNRDTTEIGITKSNSEVIIDVKVSQGSGKNIVFISKSNLGISNNVTIKITSTYPEGVMKFANSASNEYLKLPSNGIITLQDNPEYTSNEMHLHLASADLGQITIEQLPLYPGALVFDGVDDYGICDNFPILTKEKGYTVVALRQWLASKTKTTNEVLLGNFRNNPIWIGANLGAFQFEVMYNVSKKVQTDSFGMGNNVTLNNNHPFSYQISNSYNGSILRLGSKVGGNFLTVGCGGDQFYANIAIWELITLDHDATEEELTKIKDYFVKTYPWLFPDQAWTVTGKTNEDEDRATIANIMGNGNDLILSNFGFAEGSGYGLYNMQKFTNWDHVADRGDIVKNGYSVTITNSKITGSSTNYNTDILSSYKTSSTTIIFKVTGLVDGQKIFLGRKSVTDAYVIDKDGIYRSDYNIPQEDGKVIVGIGTVGFTGECNITIEQIPEYEGYLVTDGVDDEIISAKQLQFADKFTIVGDWKFMEDKNADAGLLKANQIYIYNATTGMKIYLKQGSKNYRLSCKKINALTSDGWAYDEKWDEYKVYPIGSNIDISSRLFLGFYGSSKFTRIALKNLGIYNDQLLSKDDCIKAYNYLQTLKAK